MKRVLITGIGGDISQSIARIIREERSEFSIVGTDIHLEHAGGLFADEVVLVPRASAGDYLQVIESIIDDKKIDIVIPTSEAELSVIGPLVETFGSDVIITAGKRVVETGIDKLTTALSLRAAGIPMPLTLAAEEELPVRFPCIFKAQRGSGSKNVLQVQDVDEAKYLARKYPNSVFQELLLPADQEITCSVYRTRNGQCITLQLRRRLVGGATGWAEVIRDEAIEDMCGRIALELDLRGSMNIQLIKTNEGPRVFEINPRFSSTVLMRHRLGFTDLLWAIDEAQGKEVALTDIEIGQKMVRVFDAATI